MTLGSRRCRRSCPPASRPRSSTPPGSTPSATRARRTPTCSARPGPGRPHPVRGPDPRLRQHCRSRPKLVAGREPPDGPRPGLRVVVKGSEWRGYSRRLRRILSLRRRPARLRRPPAPGSRPARRRRDRPRGRCSSVTPTSSAVAAAPTRSRTWPTWPAPGSATARPSGGRRHRLRGRQPRVRPPAVPRPDPRRRSRHQEPAAGRDRGRLQRRRAAPRPGPAQRHKGAAHRPAQLPRALLVLVGPMDPYGGYADSIPIRDGLHVGRRSSSTCRSSTT